ncbi:27376_t:CDS:2, partial [Gigaspora margarita]
MNISTSALDILYQISNLCYICQKPIKKLATVLECDHILYFNCAIGFFAIKAVEEDISDLAEALKPGNTPKPKDLSYSDAIEEISSSTAQRFLLLYKNIDQAEKLLARSEKNVIHTKKENKIVANIKKLLPSNTSINVIKKRIAIAQKIYDIFSTIDEIEFIKTGDNKPKFRIERESSNIWTDFDILQSNDPKGLNS